MEHFYKMHVIFGILLVCCCIDVNHAFSKNEKIRSKREVDFGILQKSSSYHTEQLFDSFGDNEYLDLNDLKAVVLKMGLGGLYHDHGHDHGDHGHDHGDNGHDHGDHGHDHGDHGHDHGDHEHDHGDHGHDHGDHEHDHGDHGHDHGDHGDHEHHRRRRMVVADNSSEVEKECPTMGGLLAEFSLDGIEYLMPTEFLYLCPALVNQLMIGSCGKEHAHDHAHDNEDDRNMGLVWFYLMLSVTIISLCAVWGILCIPKRSRSIYEGVIQYLMALGAGSMAGDALLHLLPHALMPPHDHSAHGHEGHDHGSHDHGSHGDEHGDHDAEHMEALLKGLVALIGLYGFFALERAFSIFLARSSPKTSGNNHASLHMHHSHSEPLEDVKFLPTSTSNNTAITDLSPTFPEENGKTHHWPHAHNVQEVNVESIPDEDSAPSNEGFCPNLTPLAMMIVLGDMFHNFCDGLAMGAAYSASTTVGISTSLAVFCHEFPHEIGDFAILIKSGLSKKWAVFLNFVSALTCYLGAIIGMFLGNNVGDAPMWIFAGVAGMFLYIALVDLIPEMTHIYITPGKRWGVFLSLHAAGLFTGSLFMLILGVYEHDIQMALG